MSDILIDHEAGVTTLTLYARKDIDVPPPKPTKKPKSR